LAHRVSALSRSSRHWICRLSAFPASVCSPESVDAMV
jgi:hypothetical protein